MNKRKSVSIYCYNEVLYYIPVGRCSRLGVEQFDMAKDPSRHASDRKKGEVLIEVLDQSGRECIAPGFNVSASFKADEFYRSVKPFLLLSKAKSWHTFTGHALSLSVDINMENSMLKFTPCLYERGGFLGIREAIFEIPIDSPLEEIGKAIGRALSLCIGKGGKRLEDFVAKNKELPSS